MKKVFFKVSGLIVASGIMMVSFQNCGMAGFEVGAAEKHGVLGSMSVLSFASKSSNAAVASGNVGYVSISGDAKNGGAGYGIPVNGGNSGSGSGSIGVGGGSGGSGSGSIGVGGGSGGSGSGSIGVGGGSGGSGSGSIGVGGGSGSGSGNGSFGVIGGGSGAGGIGIGGGGSGSGNGGFSYIGSPSEGTVGEFFVENDDDMSTGFPIKYLCSSNINPTLKRVVADVSTNVQVRSTSGSTICNENQRPNILNLKKIVLSEACRSKLQDGQSYDVELVDSAGTKQQTTFAASRVFYSSRFSSFVLVKNSRNIASIHKNLHVHYADNPGVRKTVGGTANYGTEDCDSTTSPLVIAMGKNIRKIALTPPTQGIKFDIAGSNSLPNAYSKKQISWFKNAMKDYYFVALPNMQGRVDGIDDLFGDNTKGPDGKTTVNGYAALAKFDDNKDGYITKDDKVWKKLRLWRDSNLDGQGVGRELTTLDSHGIISIDLKFDGSYSEYDAYGNETKMKSVVKMADGSVNLIFDLWFRPLDI